MAEISPDTRLGTLFRDYPELTDYLLDLGICSCEGIQAMKRTVRDEVRERKLDMDKVLEELNKRVR